MRRLDSYGCARVSDSRDTMRRLASTCPRGELTASLLPPRPSYGLSWLRVGHRTLTHNSDSIHEYILYSLGQLVRPVVRRTVDHRLRIEHHHVREETSAKLSALAQSEPVSWQRRHLPNRILQREQLLLANVSPEYAREASVRTRMRESLERVRRIPRFGIGAEHHPRLLHLHRDIGLVHRERDAVRCIASEQDLDHRVLPGRSHRLRYLRQTLAFILLELRFLESDNDYLIRRYALAVGGYAKCCVGHLSLDARQPGRIAQILQQLSVRRHIGRDARRQPVGRRRIRIHRRRNVLAGRARRIYLREQGWLLVLVFRGCRLEMIQNHRYATLATDPHRLVGRLQERIVLGAHVRYVRSVKRRHRACDLDQFRRASVRAGWIYQRTCNTERAIAHRIANDATHRVQLCGGGRARCRAHRVCAHRCRA